jgi:hypothetical protein
MSHDFLDGTVVALLSEKVQRVGILAENRIISLGEGTRMQDDYIGRGGEGRAGHIQRKAEQ